MAPTAAEQQQGAAQHTKKAVGLAARDASGHLSPLAITRRYAPPPPPCIDLPVLTNCIGSRVSVPCVWPPREYTS
jgi:hypothetical protein